jgi:hypothetical protein
MSVPSNIIPVRKYGEFSFPAPRRPCIRIWGSKALYPGGLRVHAVDDPGGTFTFTERIPKMGFPFEIDGTGDWTTATIGDFVLNRGGTASKPLEGWIYISPGEDPDPKYTIYVYDDGRTVGTKFGLYTVAKKVPDVFPNGGENYFCEMSDNQGHWLWLYRLYAKPPV